jgi:hypothetical protein
MYEQQYSNTFCFLGPMPSLVTEKDIDAEIDGVRKNNSYLIIFSKVKEQVITTARLVPITK